MSKEEKIKRQELEKAESLGQELDRQISVQSRGMERIEGLVGICASCTHFHYERTRLNEERFTCERLSEDDRIRVGHIRRLSTSDPLVECSGFEERGKMTLWDMKEIAILIEGKGAKKAPGFNRDDWGSSHD